MANKVQNCCQCGTTLFKVEEEQIVNGRSVPTKLGLPSDKANRARLVLMSGATATLTLCDDCLENPNLTIIWKEILEAFEEEKGRSKTPDDKIDKMKRLMFTDPPLGVLWARKWKDEPL